jgi:FMN reductase
MKVRIKAVVVVGNPKLGSRTREAGEIVARAVGADEIEIIEVAGLGPGLLGWGDPAVAEAKKKVQAADVAVIASPTFKATYSGLLKLSLDQFEGRIGMAGVLAIPLMLGAGPTHALAPDILLKPVLSEIGATCPTPGIYLLDSEYRESATLAQWIEQWAPVIAKFLR